MTQGARHAAEGGPAGSSKRRGQGERRRDKEVLAAAAKVFYNRGYADASVQDIADELGILKGSLYHYIESKEDLLFRLLSETHDDVQAILEDVAAGGGPPLDMLQEYTRRQVEYTSRNIPRMAIYYHDADKLSRERRRELVKKRATHEEFVTKLIEQAQQEGSANPTPPAHITANFLFGSMIWVYRWYRPRSGPSPEELAQSCAEFVLRGVAGVDGTRAAKPGKAGKATRRSD